MLISFDDATYILIFFTSTMLIIKIDDTFRFISFINYINSKLHIIPWRMESLFSFNLYCITF